MFASSYVFVQLYLHSLTDSFLSLSYSKLSEAIPKIIEVIKDNGLDDLQPLEQPILPVHKGDSFSFIDEVIESAYRRDSGR